MPETITELPNDIEALKAIILAQQAAFRTAITKGSREIKMARELLLDPPEAFRKLL